MILFFVLFCQAQSEPDRLVAELVAGHRANYERVRTMRAVFDTRTGPPEGPVVERLAVTYLRDLNGVLIREGAEGRKLTEHALYEGETRQLTRNWTARGVAPQAFGARLPSIRRPYDVDLWAKIGGAFAGNDSQPRDLATVLADSDPPAVASRDTSDGENLVRLTRYTKTTQGKRSKSETWFDPARGYVPVRSKGAGEGSSATEWQEIKMHAEGVWLPTRRVMNATTPSVVIRSELVIHELTVNQPLPTGGTTLTVPAGTVVKDEVRGTEYRANPDWSPAGPEKKWQPLVLPPVTESGPYLEPSQQEPTSGSRWLLYVAVAILVVGLSGLVVIKYRSRRGGGL